MMQYFLVVMLTLATLAFLLFRAECLNFRPQWHREKKILAALLMTTIPLILWTLRHLAPARFSSILPSLSNAGLPVCLTAIWLGSILTRARLWRHQCTVNSGIAVNPSVDGSTP